MLLDVCIYIYMCVCVWGGECSHSKGPEGVDFADRQIFAYHSYCAPFTENSTQTQVCDSTLSLNLSLSLSLWFCVSVSVSVSVCCVVLCYECVMSVS